MTEFKNGDKVYTMGNCGKGVALVIGPDPLEPTKYVHVLDVGEKSYTSRSYQCLWEQLTPYREPVKVSGWVNVYENGDCDTLLSSKPSAASAADYALRSYGTKCIARVYVSGTEGEGP